MNRMAMFIMETQTNDKGEYCALIAVEGKSGYYKTDWFWGTDLDKAEQIAQQRNERMGLSEVEAQMIVLSTMKPKIVSFNMKIKASGGQMKR